MITNIQRKFLEQLLNGEITKEDNPKRYSAMMEGIRKQIDKNIINMIWIVVNYPSIFTDETIEFDNPELERWRRFRALAYVTSKINPYTELEKLSLPEVLKKLSQFYPKYYFEISKKG